MPSLEDVRVVAATLPFSEERTKATGVSWLVRERPYAWQAYPWPSVSAPAQAVMRSEPVLVVKVASDEDKLAYLEGWPDVFLRQPSGWSEPKIALRLATVDSTLLVELVQDAWYCQAPKYARRLLDERS